MIDSDRIGDRADEAQLRYLQAAELAAQRRYAEAEEEFKTVLQLDPELHTARFQLGLLQLTCANAESAMASWAPLHDAAAPASLQKFVSGLEALIKDDLSASIALLESGIELNTTNPPLNKDMAMVIDQIRSTLQAAAQNNPAATENSTELGVRTDFSLYEK